MLKATLYFHTLKYMKPSQVYFRLRKVAGLKCSLGCRGEELDCGKVRPIPAMRELDYDPAFLSRFPAEDLLDDKVSFLHSEETVCWDRQWKCTNQTDLWNFNLHYFEYLFSLVHAYKKTGNNAYFDKTKQCISAWIRQNPKRESGFGWSAYTIALRLTVWLDYYSEMEREIAGDREFREKFLKSVHEQYVFLANHLEKDILGNHYFEDLKALVLCSLFLGDEIVFQAALRELKLQCREQILEDGMHFELSPMYHKIILEDMLRVCHALQTAGKRDRELEQYLQPMLDAAYSLEESLERIPLFNDGGDNVAKSLDALVLTAGRYFQLTPVYKSHFPAAGYYIFKQGAWKLIVDAGQPGPSYIPGHAHCDAMSFELFRNGKPILTNAGTYAYQSDKRPFFRSTAAHNTVMADGKEQSQCWGAFRLGKRASVRVLEKKEDGIIIQMKDQDGNEIRRAFKLEPGLLKITDTSKGHTIRGFLHWLYGTAEYEVSGRVKEEEQLYAPEYGVLQTIQAVSYEDESKLRCTVYLKGVEERNGDGEP